MIRGRELAAKVQTLRVLRHCSDRQLQDAGISRELMAQGVKAWPWRAEEVPSNAFVLGALPVSTEQAVLNTEKPATNEEKNADRMVTSDRYETAA